MPIQGMRGIDVKCPSCGFEFASQRAKMLPTDETRHGCVQIAQNIKAYTDTALHLLFAGQGFKRMPYILAILGMDEAGKVVKVVKKSIETENTEAKEIEVENWHAHWSKGPEASELGVLAVDWLNEILRSDVNFAKDAQSKDFEFLVGYRAHLQKLKNHFSSERNSMIYVDYNEGNGSWETPASPHVGYVLYDVILLGLFSDVVVNYLGSGRSFLALNDAMKDIRECSDFCSALSKMDELAGTSLCETWKQMRQ